MSKLSIRNRVSDRSIRCNICGDMIGPSTWYIIASYVDSGKEIIKNLCDNDACIHALKVKLGLEKASFKTSRARVY